MAQFRFKLLLLFCLLLGSSQGFAAKKIFLSIGIDTYQDPFWGNLKYSSKDAQDFAKALEPEFDGGRVLTSALDSERMVTRDKVLQALRQLSQENFNEEDYVVIYISAHGTVAKTLEDNKSSIEKFLVTADTDSQTSQWTGLAHKKLLDIFQNLKSKRKVLILDTCYSGAGKSKLTSKILEVLARHKGSVEEDVLSASIEGSIILSASAWGEEAIESAEHRNSLYTYYLLQGFSQDLNQDGAVSITEAHSYASKKVIEESLGKQHPTAKIEVVGNDPIILKGKARKGKPLLFAYEQMMRKLKVELNGNVLKDLAKGGAAVPAGTYQIAIKDLNDRVIYENDINLEEGREYSLSRFLEYDPAFSLSVGPSFHWLNQDQLRQRLGRNLLVGLTLNLRQENLIGKFFGDAQLFRSEQQENIESNGLKVKQEIKWTELGFQLGRLLNGSDLRFSGVKKDPDFFVSYSSGLHLVYLERDLQDAAYLNQHQRLLRPAFAVAAELGWENIDRNFQASLRLGCEAIRGDAQAGYPRYWAWTRLTTAIGWTF